MKKAKKFFSVVLVVAMILTCLPLTGFATDNETEPCLQIDVSDAVVGQEMTVTVSCINMADIDCGNIALSFDNEYLEYVSSNKTDESFNLGIITASGLQSGSDHTVGIAWMVANTVGSNKFTLVDITFRVIKAGDTEISYNTCDFSDGNGDEVLLSPDSDSTNIHIKTSASDSDYTYSVLPDGTAEINGYTWTETELTIPSEVDGYTVTSIGEFAFKNYKLMTSIAIPISVSNIGDFAFFNCNNLSDVYYEGTEEQWDNTVIGDYNRDLTSAIIHFNSLPSIKIDVANAVVGQEMTVTVSCINMADIDCGNIELSFDNEYLEYVSSSETDEAINHDIMTVSCLQGSSDHTVGIAFMTMTTCGSNKFTLVDITFRVIKAGDTEISYNTHGFGDDNNDDVLLSPDSAVRNININTLAEYSNYIYSMIPDGSAEIIGYTGTETELTIPSEVDGYAVTSIGDSAFEYYKLMTSITIPSSVSNIGDSAFFNCNNLSDVYYEGTEEQWYDIDIGDYNRDLKSAIIHFNSLPSIKIDVANAVVGQEMTVTVSCINMADIDCGNMELSFDNEYLEYVSASCTYINGTQCVCGIQGSSDHTVGIAFMTMTTLGSNKFTLVDITFRVIKAGDTKISYNAHGFGDDNNDDVLLSPDSAVRNVNINTFAEYSNYIYSILPDGSAEIIGYTGTETELTIPSEVDGYAVTSIGDSVFCDCKSLTSITIPSSITKIGDCAFTNCNNISDVYYEGTDEQWDNINIGHYNEDLTSAIIHFSGSQHEHDWSAWTETTPATCTEKGIETRTCTDCNVTETREIAATGHDLKHVSVPSTCTTAGVEYDVCLNCDETFNNTTLPLSNHAYGEWTVTTSATCTEKGVETRDCTICGATETREIEATGHDLKHVSVPSTCTTAGVEYDVCLNCDETFNNKTLPLSEHTYGEWTVTTPATCTEKGVETRTCTDCNAVETREIEATGHDLKHVSVPSTCTTAGVEYDVCLNCDETFNNKTLSLLDHAYGEWTVTTPATCTEKGAETRTCTVCGATETREIEATGHNLKHVSVPSTCTTAGVEYDICLNCDETFNNITLPLSEHTYGEWTVTNAATALKTGTETRTCSVCGNTETREIPKIEMTEEVKDDNSGISVQYKDDSFNSEIKLNVEQKFDGESYQIINKEKENFKYELFDISITSNGEKVQPSGSVLVKMPVPEEYNTEKLAVYYVTNSGTLEKMNSYYNNGYVYFEASHFSDYVLVDESENQAPKFIKGDVNNDGKVTASDARLALRISANLESATDIQFLAADVDESKKITASDARTILRVSANLSKF